MSRNKALGSGLAGLSLLIALVAGIYYVVDGAGIPLSVFVLPALGFLVGLAITFFGFVQVSLRIDDEIENFPQLVEDDIDHLRRRVFTNTHLFIGLTLGALVIESWLLLWYRKGDATWGPVNVLLVASAVIVITLFLSLRANWFQMRQRRLPPLVFVVPTLGWIICTLIGVVYAEPVEYGGLSPLERAQVARSGAYQDTTSSRSSYFIIDTAEGVGNAVADFDCDDEGCLVVLLIAIVVISAMASATIPHFWVVATTLLLTLMVMIALRELLYRDGVT